MLKLFQKWKDAYINYYIQNKLFLILFLTKHPILGYYYRRRVDFELRYSYMDFIALERKHKRKTYQELSEFFFFIRIIRFFFGPDFFITNVDPFLVKLFYIHFGYIFRKIMVRQYVKNKIKYIFNRPFV
jgi:hypothetical protein